MSCSNSEKIVIIGVHLRKLSQNYNRVITFLDHSVYINTFLVTRLKVRPFDGFSRAMAQLTRSQARVCHLRVRKLRNNIQPLKNPPK